MKSVIATALLISAAPLWNWAMAQDLKQWECKPTDYAEFTDLLYSELGERPVFTGRDPYNQDRIELWMDIDNGGFSILRVDEEAGMACFIAYGEDALMIDLETAFGELN